MSKKKVELLGKVFDNHSLSIVNRNLALELSKHPDIDLFITAIDAPNPGTRLNPKTINQLQQLIREDQPDIQIRHTYPPIWKHPANKAAKVVFIQPWEFSRMPFEWAYKFETFADLVITPSIWTAEVYSEAGIPTDSIKVIPNGFNPEIFNKIPEPALFHNSENMFTFVYVGNGQPRKGLDILLNAWKNAFVRADKVQLLIIDHSSIYGQSNILDECVRMQYKENSGKIFYFDQEFSEVELSNIYKNSQILVHPYRGEGFGMHVMEASACGMIPLVTAGGPTDEFLDPTTAVPINTQKIIANLQDPQLAAMKPGDSLTNMGSHGWLLQPDVSDLQNKMRFFYHHHVREDLLSKFQENTKIKTWNQVAQMYAEAILELNGTPKRFS